MSSEDRKRTYEGSDRQMNNVSKKMRPEEIGREEPGKAMCRLLFNRSQFSRIIGKGGQTISHLRSATGVFMKGSDIDEENRLVLLVGTLDQVLNAFDIITDLLQQGLIAESGGGNRPPPDLSVNLLLDHSKAGKAVGSKGSMMQTIKQRSGTTHIKIEKEPIDVFGATLRKLTIEGSLGAVRRAHLLFQELYTDPSVLSGSITYSAFMSSGGGVDPYGPPHMQAFGGGPPPAGFDGSPVPHPLVPIEGSTASVHMVPVPFPSLVNYGVQNETVRQLTEMKTYLWRHFGLDLSISREMAGPPNIHNSSSSMNRPSSDPSYGGGSLYNNNNPNSASPHGSRHGGRPSIESVIDSRRANDPSSLCFSIPNFAVGAIIGKGGANLKDLSAQFGIRVFVEKEDFHGKRIVVLSHNSEDPNNNPEVLHDCRDHIDRIVDEQMKLKTNNDSTSSEVHE